MEYSIGSGVRRRHLHVDRDGTAGIFHNAINRPRDIGAEHRTQTQQYQQHPAGNPLREHTRDSFVNRISNLGHCNTSMNDIQ